MGFEGEDLPERDRRDILVEDVGGDAVELLIAQEIDGLRVLGQRIEEGIGALLRAGGEEVADAVALHPVFHLYVEGGQLDVLRRVRPRHRVGGFAVELGFLGDVRDGLAVEGEVHGGLRAGHGILHRGGGGGVAGKRGSVVLCVDL